MLTKAELCSQMNALYALKAALDAKDTDREKVYREIALTCLRHHYTVLARS